MPFVDATPHDSTVNGHGPVAPLANGPVRPSAQPRPQPTSSATARVAAAAIDASQNKENQNNLRRSDRVPTGKSGLERLQLVSEIVSKPSTNKKRKGAPIEAIPESTAPNPMAPAEAKTKKRRGDKAPVPPPPPPVNIPAPIREPVRIVPPGTEPVLQNNTYQFGLSVTAPPVPARAQPVSRGQAAPQSSARNSGSQNSSRSGGASASTQGSFAQPGLIRNQPNWQISFVPQAGPVSRQSTADVDSNIDPRLVLERGMSQRVPGVNEPRRQQYTVSQVNTVSPNNPDHRRSPPVRAFRTSRNNLQRPSSLEPIYHDVHQNNHDNDDYHDPQNTHENNEFYDNDEFANNNDFTNNNEFFSNLSNLSNRRDEANAHGLEPGFDQSPSEDERIAENALQAFGDAEQAEMLDDPTAEEEHVDPNGDDNNVPYNVVANFHQRNRAPRSPDPKRLHAISERTSSRTKSRANREHTTSRNQNRESATSRTGSQAHREHANSRNEDRERSPRNQPRHEQSSGRNTDNATKRTRAKRHSRHAYSTTTDNPTMLRFYPRQWRQVLTNAKSKFRAWMATKCAFPDDKNPEHKEQVLECIREAMFDHNEEHGRVEEGFYPKHEDSMAAYIFEDRSTFRGEIKTVAKQVVKHHYADQIFPQEDIPGQTEYTETIANNVAKLTKNGEFCHIKPSATQPRTGNLIHPAIREVCETYFYRPGGLASKFPELFKDEVPIHTLALAATAIKCCICAYAGGFEDDTHKFDGDIYRVSYVAVLNVAETLRQHTDQYHWNTFCAARRLWASTAARRTGVNVPANNGNIEAVLD